MSEAQLSFNKSTGQTTDVKEGYYKVRDQIANVDTAVALDAGPPSYAIETGGRRNAEIRVFHHSGSGASTVTFRVKCWPHPLIDRSDVVRRGKGWVAYEGVWTMSGSTTIDKHPLDLGVTTSGNTWFEAGIETTPTFVSGSQVLQFPAGTTAAGYEKRLHLDTHACERISVEVTAFTNSGAGNPGRVIVGLRFTD